MSSGGDSYPPSPIPYQITPLLQKNDFKVQTNANCGQPLDGIEGFPPTLTPVFTLISYS